jgi:hypothetical protein
MLVIHQLGAYRIRIGIDYVCIFNRENDIYLYIYIYIYITNLCVYLFNVRLIYTIDFDV